MNEWTNEWMNKFFFFFFLFFLPLPLLFFFGLRHNPSGQLFDVYQRFGYRDKFLLQMRTCAFRKTKVSRYFGIFGNTIIHWTVTEGENWFWPEQERRRRKRRGNGWE
jgi:hypothetical protein